MSQFFIDRPIFAWVIALVIMLAGGLAIMTLPIAQYPTIAPPAITVSATYPGADADTLQSSVTQVIEQQFQGLDHLLYFSSASPSTVSGGHQSRYGAGAGTKLCPAGNPVAAAGGAGPGPCCCQIRRQLFAYSRFV
jgi:hypothetical protein